MAINNRKMIVILETIAQDCSQEAGPVGFTIIDDKMCVDNETLRIQYDIIQRIKDAIREAN